MYLLAVITTFNTSNLNFLTTKTRREDTMQFPNGVTKSNLIKLGVLGAAYYMLKGRNKTQPTIENKANNPAPVDNEPADNTAANSNGTKPAKTTAFTMGKELAAKVLGKKF